MLLVGSGCAAQNKDTWIAPIVESSTSWKDAQALGARTGSRIIYYVEGGYDGFKEIYIVEDVGDHTNRLATIRVKKGEKPEVMKYDPQGELIWVSE
jgi:hypothetical protein